MLKSVEAHINETSDQQWIEEVEIIVGKDRGTIEDTTVCDSNKVKEQFGVSFPRL